MKDSVIISVLVAALTGSMIANFCLNSQSIKWHERCIHMTASLREVREENSDLRRIIRGDQEQKKFVRLDRLEQLKAYK